MRKVCCQVLLCEPQEAAQHQMLHLQVPLRLCQVDRSHNKTVKMDCISTNIPLLCHVARKPNIRPRIACIQTHTNKYNYKSNDTLQDNSPTIKTNFAPRRHDEVEIFGTGGMILQNMKDLLQVTIDLGNEIVTTQMLFLSDIE